MHMLVLDTRTQQLLIDQLFSVPKYVRLAQMSGRSYQLFIRINRTVPKRSKANLGDVVGEKFMIMGENIENEFQRNKEVQRY